MKKVIFAVVLLAGIGAAAWYLQTQKKKTTSRERKVAFYQSSMHPWIKSDKPGTCTICGMKLTPIYEGEKGFEMEGDIVTLSSNSIQVINVQSEPARIMPIERTLNVAGRIEADERKLRVISAYVDGRIEKLFVNYVGAEVRAGTPLAIIYSPELLSAEREYLNVLSQTNLVTTPRLLQEHERLITGARERLKRLGLTDADIDALPEKEPGGRTTRIVAPISGTILNRAVVEGQYVKEGDKLFEMADLSTLWFRFDVYEQDLSWIKPGEVVEISSPALGPKTISGAITFIDPNINDAARSARVRVELENPIVGEGDHARRALYNGLYAEGRITFRTEPVLAVPRSAVLHPGDFPRVYVDSGGGAYELRKVVLGRKGSTHWEVLEGVEEDEPIVTNGNLLIDSQAQINQSVHSAGHEHEHTTSEATE